MLFRDAAAEYMADKSKRLRASTLEGYRSALELHVFPRWADVELDAITPEDVQAWVDGFTLPGAAEKAYKTLRQVIRWAIRRLGVRMYDPTAAGVELPRKAAHRPRVLDAAGTAGYLRALWGHECEAVAICSVTLGLRRGEACGLRWSDIDLRTGEVRIRRSRQEVHGQEVVVAPKTERSARSCWLPRFAVKRLRSLRKGRSVVIVSYIRLTPGFFSGNPNTYLRLGTMPAGLRPSHDVRQLAYVNGNVKLVFYAGVDGSVGFHNVGSSSEAIGTTYWGATLTYSV